MKATSCKIIDLPYPERRVIAILPSNEKESGSRAERNKWNQWLLHRWPLLITLPPHVRIPIPWWTIIVNIGLPALGMFVDWLKDKDGVKVEGSLTVDYTTALRQLRFPPGHPVIGHCYAGHPLVAERYIPFSIFHSILFEEKVNELILLLASLGASRVKVHCRKGYRKESRINAGAALTGEQKSEGLGAAIESHLSKHDEALFEEHYRVSASPRIPEEMIWYGSEKSWQAIAERRLRFATTKFQVSLGYEEDFGINAMLKSRLEGIGLKIGGSFTEFESTRWDFEGEFA